MNVALAALRLSQSKSMTAAEVLQQRETLRRDAEVLISALHSIRERMDARIASTQQIEESLEPCVSDLESCVRSQDPVFEKVRNLDEPTRHASERLIQQARLLKKMPEAEKLPAQVDSDITRNFDDVASA